MEGDLRRALGAGLRTRREAEGLSQESFANRLRLHRTYLGTLERGEQNITLDNLERLGARLGVAPLSLLCLAEQSRTRSPDGTRADHDLPAWTLRADSAQDIRDIVAANVRRERLTAGFSQRALAQSSQVGEDTIVRLEKGQQEARLVTLVAAAFALGVPLSSLLLDLPSL